MACCKVPFRKSSTNIIPGPIHGNIVPIMRFHCCTDKIRQPVSVCSTGKVSMRDNTPETRLSRHTPVDRTRMQAHGHKHAPVMNRGRYHAYPRFCKFERFRSQRFRMRLHAAQCSAGACRSAAWSRSCRETHTHDTYMRHKHKHLTLS